MIPRVTPGTTGLIGVCLLVAAGRAVPALAAPAVLRSADVQIEMTAPTACAVVLTVAIDSVQGPVEHRLEMLDGATVTPVDSLSAATDPPRDIGRTRALIVRPGCPSYSLRYRVTQPPSAAFRCPLWLPTTPTDGRSRAVRIRVQLPGGAQPSGTMPAFTWQDGVGTATLGHLPAFVRVPYAADGVTAPWNLARLMDGVSVGVLVVASALWLLRNRRAGASGGGRG
jgi:hypothetical protein